MPGLITSGWRSVGSTRSSSPPRFDRRKWALAAIGGAVWLGTSACSASTKAGRLGYPAPITEEGQNISLPFWQNSWIAAFSVGGFTLALILWSIVVYRRRKGQGLPRQVRYNLPLELLYTAAPAVIVLVMFVFTAQDQATLTKTSTTYRNEVNVVGFRWAWTFNYTKDDAYDTGTPDSPSTLWLPVNEKTRFNLTSPDVIHDFWVPAFLFKMDVIPGRLNQFELTPNQLGTYVGKCAELCGVDHSRMLFNVKVVSQADYDAHIASLRANGQSGQLPTGRVVTTGVQ
jgi:cytochrome c oxidase subunit 2